MVRVILSYYIHARLCTLDDGRRSVLFSNVEPAQISSPSHKQYAYATSTITTTVTGFYHVLLDNHNKRIRLHVRIAVDLTVADCVKYIFWCVRNPKNTFVHSRNVFLLDALFIHVSNYFFISMHAHLIMSLQHVITFVTMNVVLL